MDKTFEAIFLLLVTSTKAVRCNSLALINLKLLRNNLGGGGSGGGGGGDTRGGGEFLFQYLCSTGKKSKNVVYPTFFRLFSFFCPKNCKYFLLQNLVIINN